MTGQITLEVTNTVGELLVEVLDADSGSTTSFDASTYAQALEQALEWLGYDVFVKNYFPVDN